jgi:predicted DNA-binding transcriptional regulator AlpA
MVTAGKFPAPYRLGDGWFCHWRLEDIERWESEQKPDATPKPRKRRDDVAERAA